MALIFGNENVLNVKVVDRRHFIRIVIMERGFYTMADENFKLVRKHGRRREDIIQKITVYKDTSLSAMKNVLEFDTLIVKSNSEYLDDLLQADKIEYEILKDNMAKAESVEERQAIRDRMAEMKKERYEKDTENKSFYETQQLSHKNYTKQVLVSVAIATGLFKYRKPIIGSSKKLISKQ